MHVARLQFLADHLRQVVTEDKFSMLGREVSLHPLPGQGRMRSLSGSIQDHTLGLFPIAAKQLITKRNCGGSVINLAAFVLEISSKQAGDLFLGMSTDIPLAEITRFEAATAVASLIEKGEVQWPTR